MSQSKRIEDLFYVTFMLSVVPIYVKVIFGDIFLAGVPSSGTRSLCHRQRAGLYRHTWCVLVLNCTLDHTTEGPSMVVAGLLEYSISLLARRQPKAGPRTRYVYKVRSRIQVPGLTTTCNSLSRIGCTISFSLVFVTQQNGSMRHYIWAVFCDTVGHSQGAYI